MNINYVTKVRGGYDEISDRYEAITGIIVDDYEFGDREFYNGVFVDSNGDTLEISFPPTLDYSSIRVQSTARNYNFKEVDKSNLEDNIIRTEKDDDVGLKVFVNYEELDRL